MVIPLRQGGIAGQACTGLSDYEVSQHGIQTAYKAKICNANGLVNYIEEDGRIHSKFNQTITATGRISSTEPNLQNIPVRVRTGTADRKVFSEDGYILWMPIILRLNSCAGTLTPVTQI